MTTWVAFVRTVLTQPADDLWARQAGAQLAGDAHRVTHHPTPHLAVEQLCLAVEAADDETAVTEPGA